MQIDKNSLYTVGKDSFMTDLINRAGGESVTKDIATAYPKISKETALALNPEAIILSDSETNREPNEVFANSPAVRNGKVYRVNADLLSRPAPRIVEGLEQLARALHPESFGEFHRRDAEILSFYESFEKKEVFSLGGSVSRRFVFNDFDCRASRQ
jgi:iron complex transport system substrate-binding protein